MQDTDSRQVCRCRLPRLALATLAAFAFALPASGAEPKPRPDPMDASATVPAQRSESAFAGYQRYREQSAGSWREANETVLRAGGWRAYARERALPPPGQPGLPVSPAIPPAATPAGKTP